MAWRVRITPSEEMGSHQEMQETIALEIERHLEVNRGAADSAEGIRAWWLSPRLRSAPLEHVIAALEHLAAHGVVEKRSVGMGVIYAAAASPATRH